MWPTVFHFKVILSSALPGYKLVQDQDLWELGKGIFSRFKQADLYSLPKFFWMFFTWLACERRPISGLSAWKVTYYIAYTYKIAQIC